MQYTKLYKVISEHFNLEQEDAELVRAFFKYQSVAKGTTLIQAGEYTDKAFFIVSGYLKYFKTIDSGEELIIHLYTPDSFAVSLKSFFLGSKADETLQTITDCEYLSVSKADMEYLYSVSHKWHTFGRKLLEAALIEKEERIIDQLSLTAQERYAKLLEQQPDIIQHIPVKYIASFIGVQPESLSRIRKTN